MLRPATCELDSVVSGWESRALKQPNSSDYSTRVYDKQALAQTHASGAKKPPRAVPPWSTCSSNQHVLCPTMQALEKRRAREEMRVAGVWADGRKGGVSPDHF